ncbi:unnamed protein product [Mytilus edulis]|uniref:Uncharacterized protein n=1 Tax=Mytilus edulis TaxID=6550 RepID=A0A8S3VDP6_MYTED|nr:unnamed protein product [Mytilus edulis]
MKILISITKCYTTESSTKILEIVRAIWNSTDDKDGLKMEEIVIAAYNRNCFNLLLWIYEYCNSYISTNVRKLLMKACKDGRIEVAKWILQAFDTTLLDINEIELFLLACKKMFKSCISGSQTRGRVRMVKFVYANFQIKPLDLKSGLCNVLSVLNSEFMRENRDEVSDLVVSLLEKCFNCLNAKDLEEMMKIFFDQKYYVVVNWFLEKKTFARLKNKLF